MTEPTPEGLPGDMPPIDSLDAAFELPEWITDQTMRNLYEVMVARLRREAAHLQLTTLQELLIERVSFYYIVIKIRDRMSLGEPGGWGTAASQKDGITFWLAMQTEFNKQIRSVSKGERDILMKTLVGAVNRALRPSNLLSEELSEQLRVRLAAELKEAGL